MSSFAGEIEHSTEYDSLSLAWLAGLLEAEGTFLRSPPSYPNTPAIACGMTDLDVIERVAGAFGTSIGSYDRPGCKTEFSTRVRGSRALDLASDLEPLMSERRTRAIQRMRHSYTPPLRKLSFAKAELIRDRYRDGETAASLARAFGVTHQSIKAVLNSLIYVHRAPQPWRAPIQELHFLDAPPDGISRQRFAWLAGWLEGEGSFTAPPPSAPGSPRILGVTKDHDVALEVGRLLRRKPGFARDPRDEERGWAPKWRLLLNGTRAVELMLALRPMMGNRRRAQIDRALRATADQRTRPGRRTPPA